MQPSAVETMRQALSSLYQAATQAAATSHDPYLDLLQAGDRALAKGDYTAAQEAFAKAAKLDPERLEALEGLATTYSASDQFKLASEVYAKVADLAVQRERATSPGVQADGYKRIGLTARHNQAVSLSREGRLGEAADVFRRLVAEDPSNIRYRFNLAVLLQARQQLSDAMEAWRPVVAEASSLPEPDAAFACSAMGQVLMDLDQPEQAVEAYVQATKFAPKDADAWLNYSVAARASGSLGKAILAGRKAAGLAEKNDSLHSHLGGLYLDLYRQTNDASHLKLAIESWQRSLELNPQQPKLQELLEHYRELLKTSSQPATTSQAT